MYWQFQEKEISPEIACPVLQLEIQIRFDKGSEFRTARSSALKGKHKQNPTHELADKAQNCVLDWGSIFCSPVELLCELTKAT